MLYLLTISIVLVVVQSWVALTLVLTGTVGGFFLGYWLHHSVVKAKENNLKQNGKQGN